MQSTLKFCTKRGFGFTMLKSQKLGQFCSFLSPRCSFLPQATLGVECLPVFHHPLMEDVQTRV